LLAGLRSKLLVLDEQGTDGGGVPRLSFGADKRVWHGARRGGERPAGARPAIIASHQSAGRGGTGDAPALGHLHRVRAQTGHRRPNHARAIVNYTGLLSEMGQSEADIKAAIASLAAEGCAGGPQ
jgi:hypothetical protein